SSTPRARSSSSSPTPPSWLRCCSPTCSPAPDVTEAFLGRHAILDLYDCANRELLDDKKALQQLFRETAEHLKCTIVNEVFHTFTPQGVSGVVVIAESHLSVHTWPELGYAAVDLYTCGDP